MIDFTPITLHAQETFERYMARDNIALSDMNFTNCFMWRHAREIAYAVLEDMLVIQTRYAGSEPFVFFPIGADCIESALRVLENLKVHYASLNLPLHLASMSKEQANIIDLHFGIKSIPVREKFDYIYNVAQLIALSGRKYHKKKNHLNAFLQEYPHFVFEEISARNIPAILETYEMWFGANPNKNTGLEFEYLGIKDALMAYEKLGLKGGVIFINGKVVAFSFGEVLPCVLESELSTESNKGTESSEQGDCARCGKVAVMHIEKADSQYRGIYQAINQQVLEHCFSDCMWVNREEDLGIEGLRKAKLSYQPAFLLEKFKATIQG
ncbi:DUF2156 domain-containing protein [uncultured Helicobacter sp.]|uniref:DUF2156 domain-containing protein n=1 Tax=uncultured Helicobacter sp. TaxID=175537 RepID=UPI001C396C9E|nr:DUF2156 domain-containing protein [Candidatus Helicobacter avicola]